MEKWESYGFGARSSLVFKHFLALFQWPKIWKRLSGKWLSQCLMNCIGHESSSSGVQARLGCVTVHVTLCLTHLSDTFPALAARTRTLPPARPLSAEHGLCKQQALAISQREAGGPWEQWHPAEQGKTLPKITVCMTCCKSWPSWGLFLIASCLAAKNTTLSNQHRLRWQRAIGKVALQASTAFPLL